MERNHQPIFDKTGFWKYKGTVKERRGVIALIWLFCRKRFLVVSLVCFLNVWQNLPQEGWSASISDIEILEWHCEWEYGTSWLIGELKNNSNIATGVELQAICRDEKGRVVDTGSFWPASIKNIPARSTWPIKYPVTDKRNVKSVTLRVIGVKVWK